jgi:hypothetical protein
MLKHEHDATKREESGLFQVAMCDSRRGTERPHSREVASKLLQVIANMILSTCGAWSKIMVRTSGGSLNSRAESELLPVLI